MPNSNLAPTIEPPFYTCLPLDEKASDESESLVWRIRSSDAQAEQLLAKRFHAQIKQIGRKLGADATLCEDLAQEVMLKVILSLRQHRLKDATKLSAYINQIARFTYYQWQRNKNSQLALQASCDDAKHSIDVEQEYLTTRHRLWVRKQIEKLSRPRDRQLLVRIYYDHQDKGDVCSELDLSHDQFDKLIFRARSRLKKVVHG